MIGNNLLFRFCLLFSGLIIINGCGQPKPDIGRFINRVIVFPKTLFSMTIGEAKQSVDTAATVKIVTYIGSERCDDCSLRILSNWKQLMADLDTVALSVEFVFVFAPRQVETLYSGLQVHRFTYPVLCDSLRSFEWANPDLPVESVFRTFLLDSANRVVLVGSPIGNRKLWELYKQQIGKLTGQNGAAE